MGAFKAYDIRGIYNRDFDKEFVYKVGYFLTTLLQADVVAIGRDVRLSSDEIFSALSQGIIDSGCDVWDIGLATTPMVYFATVHLGVKASVQITASHNPAIYNGLKISRQGALPVGQDSGLKELEEMVNSGTITVKEKKGKIVAKPVKEAYLEFLRPYVGDFSALNITVDLSHGMANLIAKDLLGSQPNYLYDHLDGTFPAHEPNPLDEGNLVDIKAAVKANRSDIGVIFDGDADRVMFITEEGEFIQPDYITALIGEYYLSREKGTVLQDIRTSRSTTEHLEELGGEVVTWKVGHAFAKLKLRQIGGIFGGELAGHYYFRDFFHCDSGMLAALLVLQSTVKLKQAGKSLSAWLKDLVVYANSGELNYKLGQKDVAMQALYEKYRALEPSKILDFDGYRIEFPSWWFNVRKSNTEPYLRLVVEAKNRELLEAKVKELTAVIESFK
ncbi:MAG: phosphomannomutase/phosphoglucomutase [Sphaerochaetaceae bacterium]